MMEVIANGGFCGNEANTMEALLLTRNIKYIHGVLIDVRKTQDNVLVLSSYDDLAKKTLSNKKISTSIYEDIRKIKFPSHIFKYYIPTLDEFLKKYLCDKKIFLRLYNVDNNYLNILYNILNKYNYKYFYIIDDIDLELIKKHELCKIGNICNNYIYLDKISDDNNYNEDIYIISKNPIKISCNNTNFDNMY